MAFNRRQNSLDLMIHNNAKRFPRFPDMVYLSFPGDRSMTDGDGPDWWGVQWLQQPPLGQIQDEKAPFVITDLENWREQLVIPDPETAFDWEKDGPSLSAHWNREDEIGAMILSSGHFERLTALCRFESALTAFYDDIDEELEDFFSEVTAYKIKCLHLMKRYVDPDIVVYHDDWGTNKSLMFAPEKWHRFIKNELKKIVDTAHELGILFEMHSDGNIQELVGPLVEEVGIDIIQPLQYPQNDIRLIKEKWGDRLIIRGGYDGQLLMRKDVSEEEKRASIQTCLPILAKGGNHIPYFTRVGDDFENAVRIFNDELDRYEKDPEHYIDHAERSTV